MEGSSALPALSSMTTKRPSASSAVISIFPTCTLRSAPPSMIFNPGSSCSILARRAFASPAPNQI